MNTGEDESTSGLNGRLRPRKSYTTIPSPVGRSSRKAETKPIQEKQKRNNTPSKTPNKTDDLTKPQSSPDPQFLCPYCDRKFASKLSASKHARRIHLSTSKQDNFIKCLYCNLSEADPHDVIRHMVDSHPNQYFACLNCHTRFPSTTELAEHKLNVCEKQKAPYRSKLRQKHSHNSTKNKKKNNVHQKGKFSSENKKYTSDKTFNGIVISCELKPSQIQDAADIEDNITTNLILPPGKTLANTNLEKNAVIVLDDVQWNKRITPNFTFHNTDADQILSRLGVVHRSPRVGESTRRAWCKMIDENNPKFEKCFDTNFYTRVASNVQENLSRFLDGSFNFNPDAESTIKTRKSKSSVIINTAEGFPILLAYEQFSRHVLDGYMPRQLAPRHKWKWDTTENADNALVDPNTIKSDSHVNNCIITLVSSLDIWTQLRMRRKYEDVFSKTSSEKTEINNIIASELKEILESREIPAASSQVVKYINTSVVPREDRPELPSYLGLSPVEPKCELEPAVLSGEWVRPRCYVCCACGAQTRDSRGLTSHMSTQHPNAQVQHYEIVGEPLLNADIVKHLYVPPSQMANRTRPPRGFRDCTKCNKSIALEDLHQHMLDCAGDTPTVRRKCRYRPFGVRKRRPRLPDNTIRKKIRKDIRSRQRHKVHMRPRPKIRTEVGDAETIRKMIADLPAKRVRVSLNSPLNVKTRKVIENQRNKLKIKRQNADELKNIVTRSKKFNTKGVDGDKQSIDSQSDDDDEPLKISTKTTSAKKSLVTFTKTSTASTKAFNKTSPMKIKTAEVNVRQKSDNNQERKQGGKEIGGAGNKGNGNENNVSHGRGTPLKHSIASITSKNNILPNSNDTLNKEENFQKNNIENKDSYADTLRIFEDETKSDKLDKPPLQNGSKHLDPGGLQKSKLNKPRKRLNDCIAMLMQKTSKAQEHQSFSEVEIDNLPTDRGCAKSSTANTELREQFPAEFTKERSIGPSRGGTPIVDDSVTQVPDIAPDTMNDIERSLVAGRHSYMLRTPATMFSQSVDPEFMTRLTTEATHFDALRHNILPHGGLNVHGRRRSHGDPDFPPPRMTDYETSKRRSSRLKSDTLDYQPRPQYVGLHPGYLGIMPSSLGEYYDMPYASMRRPSYDGSTLLPVNQPLYHPQFLPGPTNTLGIPIMSKSIENQYSVSLDIKDKKNRKRMCNMPDVVQNPQLHYTSQSPDSRRNRWSSTSSTLSDFDSSQIYSQKSPDGRVIDLHNRGQVNNNYIVSPNATPKVSPRHRPASTRSQREAGKKSLKATDSEIHIQRQRNHNRIVEDSPEHCMDHVSSAYYPSKDIECSSISPLSYETSKKAPEVFYSRVPSKCNENTSFMEHSTSDIHRKALNVFGRTDEYFERRSHNPKPDEDNLNVMNLAHERSVGHRHTPSKETERVLFRESPTHHKVENIINIDQRPQQYTNNMRTHEPTPTFEMVPLDLRPQHKILSDMSQTSQQKMSVCSQSPQQKILSNGSQISQQKILSGESQCPQHNILSNTFQDTQQNVLSDISQNIPPRLYVRDITELTGFGPAPIQNIHSNESARHGTQPQNIQDNEPLDLNKSSMYTQSTSTISGQTTMTDLEVSRTDNNILSSSILKNNVITRPSIPTITLSPPDNGNITETSGHSSSNIQQNSIQEPEQMQSYDKITIDRQDNTNPSLRSQTPPADPTTEVNVTHKKTHTTDKRKLVPKEIIAVIEDLPQEQRDRLLDILPQFVRMSDSNIETNDEGANNNDQTNKDVSTITLSELPNDSTNIPVSNLSINTNLMPAPSCVIPKKRHSPNVTYSSQINVSRTDIVCSTNSLVAPVHPPTVEDVTPVGTDCSLIKNTEELTNTENQLIDPYTGVMESRTDLLNHDNIEKDGDCNISTTDITKRVESPMSLKPIKTAARSKMSNEKTSLLRRVRFNSSRKSLSDDKQLICVKDKSIPQNNDVHQTQNEENQNNLPYSVNVGCEKTVRAKETLQHIQNNSDIMQTLNNSSALVIKDTNEETNEETTNEKRKTLEQDAKVNSHHSNFASDNFLETDTSLTKGGPYPEMDPIHPSANEKVESNKFHDVGLQTLNEINLPVNDSVYSVSVDTFLPDDKIECSKPPKLDTSIQALKETKNECDSDDEDISLADIAKLQRPTQPVIKRKKRNSTKNSKIIKKGKKKPGHVKNILELSLTKSTNKNRRTKILTSASSDNKPKDVLSNDEIKQQGTLIKSTDQINEVTTTNPQHFQELNVNKKIDVTVKSIQFDKMENANQNTYTEETVNEENNRRNDSKFSEQDMGLQDVKDKTIEDTILDKIDEYQKKIVSKEHKENTNNSFIKKSTDALPIAFETAQNDNISENIIKKSHTNETEKDNAVAAQKPLLTKKQLIFSKMLCDDETVTLTQNKESRITNDGSSSVNVPPTSDNIMKKVKPIKRRKSPQAKRKNKKQMKHLNFKPGNESESSQNVQETSTEKKQKKKDLNNCIQELACTKGNLDGPVDATVLLDKQSPTSEKRKSDKDISTKPKKTKLNDTGTIEDAHYQSNHQDIFIENKSEITESGAENNNDENVLKIIQKVTTNSENRKVRANAASETRTTCYNRQIDYKPSGSSSIAKVCKNYDPYDIDLDESIATTEPAIRKSKHAWVLRKISHTAKPKSPTPLIQSHNMSSSDSESSKSDVPLQKYVEEKRMLEQNLHQQLEHQLDQQLDQKPSNNDQENIETPDSAVDTLNVSETAATANNLEIFLDIDLYSAEQAKSIFIPPEEALNVSSFKKIVKDTKNNNEQQNGNQSTSTESQNKIINPIVNQVEQTFEIGNVDVAPRVIESNKNKENQKNVNSLEIEECLESEETKNSKASEENTKCKENTEIKDIDINENVDIEQKIENKIDKENKECEESKEPKEIKEKTETTDDIEEKESVHEEVIEIKEINESVEKEIKKCIGKELNASKALKGSKEKKRRRSNNTLSVDTVDNTKTSEQTNTDKYLENFGFFSERKPRKSNLLASKKITETIHMINEGDDVYFSSKNRPTKKCHRETRKSTEGDISIKMSQGTTKCNVDISEQPKINGDENKKVEHVNRKDSIMDVDINLNTAGVPFNKTVCDLESKVITELREDPDPSKQNDNLHSIHIEGPSPHNETLPKIHNSIDVNDTECTSVVTKKPNKNKIPKVRPPGYKEKMYPDIEEIDLFEDKFDKIKRKSRTQAAAAKLSNVVDANPSISRKKTEKKKKKCEKKSYHSSVVPTKGALKGFDGIKISISTHDLNVPPNVSPPRQKKRKRSSSNKKVQRRNSESSSKYDSDNYLRDMNVQERDIYEFKDNDDTELLELRPSTVMDRFRSLNKEKSKQKEKGKDKDPQKYNKTIKEGDSDNDDDVKNIKQLDDIPTREYETKTSNSDLDIKFNKNNRETAGDHYKFDDEILSGSVEKVENPSNNKDTKSCNNFSQEQDASSNAPNDDEAHKPEDDEDDDDDDDDNVCLVTRSRFVPPTNDDSSFEWNGSPESGFVHMSGGNECTCLPDSELDNDTDRICDSSNCIYRKTNHEKNAVMGKIFKNNAVRRDTSDVNTNISPKANLDQLFDSLLETNSNDVSSEQNNSGKDNKEISPIPGPSSQVFTSYGENVSHPMFPKPESSNDLVVKGGISKRNKKSRSRDSEDAFSRLMNKDDTSAMPPPYVTPPKIYEASISSNKDKYGQCILSHNEDACSSDSTDQSNNVIVVDEYVMMSSKYTQTEDPETVVEDTSKIKVSNDDDDESDLEGESNDIIVLKRNVSTKSRSLQTDFKFETEYYSGYGELVPRPGDYAMMTSKSTQTRRHKSNKSKNNDDLDSDDEELFNAFEKTKITLKKFVATTTKTTQTEHQTKLRKTSKHDDSSSSLTLAESSTSIEKRFRKKKVLKMETKVRADSDEESSAKEDDGIDIAINNSPYEPVAEEPATKSEERVSQDDGVNLDNLDDDAGVARQRVPRKCTVGKQNVLAEHWSSESEVEALGPRASSASSVVASGSRKRRGRKREGKRRSSDTRRGRGSEGGEERGAPHGPSMRARPALTHWSSENEEDTGMQPQHGWIVGDSHKKLVTLLANAKGRKRHNTDKRHTDE